MPSCRHQGLPHCAFLSLPGYYQGEGCRGHSSQGSGKFIGASDGHSDLWVSGVQREQGGEHINSRDASTIAAILRQRLQAHSPRLQGRAKHKVSHSRGVPSHMCRNMSMPRITCCAPTHRMSCSLTCCPGGHIH